MFSTDGALIMGGYNGFLTSTDHGSSWTASPQLGGLSVTAFTASQGIWFAGAEDGIYRSTDKGTTWSRLPGGDSLNSSKGMTGIATGVAGSMTSAIFTAEKNGGILRSTDLGFSWQHADAGISGQIAYSLYTYTYSLLIAGKVRTFGSVYAGVGLNGAWVTTNQGTTWSKVAPGLEGHYINTLLAAGGPTGDTLLAGTREGIFVHASGDSVWHQMLKGIPACDVSALVGGRSTIHASTQRGVFVSNDCGVTWTRLGQGLPKLAFERLAANASYLFGGSVDLERRSHTSGTWEILPFAASHQDRIIDIDAGWGSRVNIVAWNDSGYWSSTDNGSTWIRRGQSQNAMWNSITHNTARARLYGGLYGSVVVSTDNGATWTRTGVGTFPPKEPVEILRSVTSGPISSVVAAAGDSLYYTENDGATWIGRKVPPGGPGTYQHVKALQISGTHWYAINGATGYAPRLFRSSNAGVSWDTLHPPTRDPSVLAWSDPYIVAAGYDSIAISKDNGTTWTPTETPHLEYFSLSDLIVFHDTLFVVAAPGLMKRALATIITSAPADPGEVPGSVQLYQCYPDPFNPSTVIRYALPSRVRVQVSVYNTLGQEVAILQNGEQEAGMHEVRFDGANLSSGVYFYTLRAGSVAETRKALLLR
jgi:photosystem II stability/assembly factor-like uncharacterized protein